MVVVKPFGRIRDDNLMLSGNKQAMGNDSDVYVRICKPLQGLRHAIDDWHGRIKVVGFCLFVSLLVLLYRAKRPTGRQCHFVLSHIRESIGCHTTSTNKPLTHGFRIIRADAVKI